MVKVQIKKLYSDVELPCYETDGSSGVDLKAYINSTIVIKPQTKQIIPTGISISFPKECEVQVRPRSGLAAKSNISVLNTPGTIDSDYRGEIKIILFNHGSTNFIIKKGERIAQMVLMPVLKFDFEEVQDLSFTNRGEDGFGSTGK
tara:strand:- start:348 stop:785 length:438 start_codon:yes stop_codon:yes gene_type:complete